MAEGTLEAGRHAYRVEALSAARPTGIFWIEMRAGSERLIRRIVLP